MIGLSKKSMPSLLSLRALGAWWTKWSHACFILLLLGVLALAMFSWYRSLYLFHWDGEKEREYRISRDTQVKFQRERFEAMLDRLEERALDHRKPPQELRNLFIGEQKK